MHVSNLQKRLLFALWAVPLGWFVVNAPWSILPASLFNNLIEGPDKTVFLGQLCTILVIVLATQEYIRMLSVPFRRNGFWLVYFWLAAKFITYYAPSMALSKNLDIFLLLMIIAAEALIWGRNTKRWKRTSLLFSGTLFIWIASYSLFDFYRPPFQTIFQPDFSIAMFSQPGIVTVVAATFLCDTAAYFAGSYLGRHHFTSISPKKTIEGSLAGLCAAMLTASIGWYFWANPHYPFIFGPLLGILIGISAQVGDLIVSLMKRYFRVKDSSDIIPGHGGVLDRFDSIFFMAPVIGVYFSIIDRFFP